MNDRCARFGTGWTEVPENRTVNGRDGQWVNLWAAAAPILADAVEAFGEAAFFFEIFGKTGDLPVEKGAGHSDQEVGGDFIVARSIPSIGSMPRLFEAGAGDIGGLGSVFLEVPLALPPSAMFRTPLRASRTIRSWVRLCLLTKRSQKRTVGSKVSRRFGKPSACGGRRRGLILDRNCCGFVRARADHLPAGQSIAV